MDMNIFEYAIEHKLRFPYKGSVSTEDLYDLSVTELDSIYKTLKREVKKNDEESLLAKKSEADIAMTTKIEIVKHIVSKRIEEANAREVAAQNRKQKEKIMAIIAQKQEENLHGKSIEELQTMLDGMN